MKKDPVAATVNFGTAMNISAIMANVQRAAFGIAKIALKMNAMVRV